MEWTSADGVAVDIALPVSFAERLRGMRGSEARAMLFRAASVHGIGMDRPLQVVAIDRQCRVIAHALLRPNRVAWVPRAQWMLELDPSVRPPAIGTRVAFYPLPDGGTTRRVRDTDRQPRRRLRAARRGIGRR